MSTDPLANPSPLYYVMLGGKRTPGIATVTGNSGAPRKWDERGGYGLSGSTLVLTGKGLGKFDILLELYTSQDWADWAAFRPLIEIKPTINGNVYDVSHPWLADYKITKCVVLDEALPKLTDEGVGQILIPCQAFRKPKFTLSKPTSAQATPTDPVDAQIAVKEAELTSVNQQLAGK